MVVERCQLDGRGRTPAVLLEPLHHLHPLHRPAEVVEGKLLGDHAGLIGRKVVGSEAGMERQIVPLRAQSLQVLVVVDRPAKGRAHRHHRRMHAPQNRLGRRVPDSSGRRTRQVSMRPPVFPSSLSEGPEELAADFFRRHRFNVVFRQWTPPISRVLGYNLVIIKIYFVKTKNRPVGRLFEILSFNLNSHVLCCSSNDFHGLLDVSSV